MEDRRKQLAQILLRFSKGNGCESSREYNLATSLAKELLKK